MPKIVPIVGHLLQQEQLQNDIEFNNVSHAYLFAGPAHIGKRSLAMQFAWQLLSHGRSDEERAAVKSAVEKLTHTDLFVLDKLWMADTLEDWNELAKYSNVPQAHRKKNAAKTDVIGIDDIRALQERLHETGSGTYRCCLITSVERMQAEAANAFLKLLEEPPEGLVFLLTTQSRSTLLPTITSRSRVVNFSRVSPQDMRPLFGDVDDNDKAFIAHIAAGAPGMVLRLKNDPDLLRLHRTIHGTAQSFWHSRSVAERMNILTPLSKRGEESDQLLLHLGITLREQAARMKPENVQAFVRLTKDLHTNAHRQLLAHRFAMEVS